MNSRIPLAIGTIASVIAISATPSISQTLEEKLLGTWETKILTNRALFIFTPKGKLLVVLPTKFEDIKSTTSTLSAFTYQYKVDSKTQPAQVHLESDMLSGDNVSTILEIGQNGTLKIQLNRSALNGKQPIKFTPSATILTRVSNSTLTPNNIAKYNDLSQSRTVQSLEYEPKSLIDSINRAQIAYRSEEARFAPSFDALALGTLTGKNKSETSIYSYTLFSHKNRTYVTAAAKIKDVKSYVGAVYRGTNSKKQLGTWSAICETENPTGIPPKFPKFLDGTDPIKCPPGSQIVK